MHFFLIPLLLACAVVRASAEMAPMSDSDYEVLKVNHELLNAKGDNHQEADIGDLVAKARYQRSLDSSTNEVTGIRFHVHWRAPSSEIPKFAVKVEARGIHPATNRDTYEILVKTYPKTPSFSGWTVLDLKDEIYRRFGRVMAWKVTLLQNGKPMATRQSFTWDDSIVPSLKTN